MTRWLMKFEVEAHLGTKADVGGLVFKHPQGTYEVHLQNADVRPGIELPLVYAYVLFDAENIETAATDGARHLGDFIDTLVFCTGSRFRKRSRLSLFDWTPDVKERHGRIYKSQPDPNVPQLVLDESLVPALETCLVGGGAEALRRAIRWFSNGVSASYQDEQFQMFWFSIETVASTLSMDAVPDRCARCREPLFCPKCNEIATHKPYPKQKIEELFKKHLTDHAEELFLAVSDMRNALSHGDKVSEVEKKHGHTLAQLVDVLGKVAWVVLFDAIRKAADPTNEGREIRLVQPTTFLHYRVEPTAFVSFTSPEGREPVFSDIPNLEMELEMTRTGESA